MSSSTVFDPFPQEFDKYNIALNGYCYVIVHPGYSTYEAQDKTKTREYGAYPEYLRNLKQLVRYLKESEELTIVALEDRMFHGKIESDEDLSIDSALIIVTEDTLPKVKPYVKTPDGKRRQRIGTIYSFLRDNNIHEARFAGEWAWWDGNGCLGVLASNFCRARFSINGLEGCIYPTVAPEKNNKTLARLYSNTVKIPFTTK